MKIQKNIVQKKKKKNKTKTQKNCEKFNKLENVKKNQI